MLDYIEYYGRFIQLTGVIYAIQVYQCKEALKKIGQALMPLRGNDQSKEPHCSG